MTRVVFVAVAKILGEVDMPHDTRVELVERFSALFESNNSRFDRARFRQEVSVSESARWIAKSS